MWTLQEETYLTIQLGADETSAACSATRAGIIMTHPGRESWMGFSLHYLHGVCVMTSAAYGRLAKRLEPARREALERLKSRPVFEQSAPVEPGNVYLVKLTGNDEEVGIIHLLVVRHHPDDLESFLCCPVTDFPCYPAIDVGLGNFLGGGYEFARCGITRWVSEADLRSNTILVAEAQAHLAAVRGRLADLVREREPGDEIAEDLDPDLDEHMEVVDLELQTIFGL